MLLFQPPKNFLPCPLWRDCLQTHSHSCVSTCRTACPLRVSARAVSKITDGSFAKHLGQNRFLCVETGRKRTKKHSLRDKKSLSVFDTRVHLTSSPRSIVMYYTARFIHHRQKHEIILFRSPSIVAIQQLLLLIHRPEHIPTNQDRGKFFLLFFRSQFFLKERTRFNNNNNNPNYNPTITTTMSARFLLRSAWMASRPRFATASRITPSALRFFAAPANQAAQTDAHRYEKLVEESIKKLMTTTNDTQDEQLKPISDEDLEVRLQYFQVRSWKLVLALRLKVLLLESVAFRNPSIHRLTPFLFFSCISSQKVFEEAELCLSDLRDTLFEADYEQYLEECSCAEGALNNAFTAYVDLLEDMRRSSEEQLLAYSEERNTNACNLKRLRKELDKIISVANDRNDAKITWQDNSTKRTSFPCILWRKEGFHPFQSKTNPVYPKRPSNHGRDKVLAMCE